MSTDSVKPILQVKDLTKVYGRELQFRNVKLGRRIIATDNVSFDIKKGEIFGFLGPNGAGKTTTIRAILGYLSIKTGSVKIFDQDYLKDGLAIRKKIGHIPGDVTLYGNFTGKELIKYLGKFRSTDHAFLKKLRSIFKVDLSQKIGSLSSGNRQQVAIIVALASNPDFLILDEPSSGLDPLMASRFHDLLREMRDQGKTIFLSSHDLAEVQAICDRVGIIRHGKIIVIESVKKLRRKSMQHMNVEFVEGEAPDIEAIKANPNVVSVEKRDGTVFHITVKEDINDLLKIITSNQIIRMTLEDTSLEEIFIEYYKDEIDRLEEE
jgi:ABC-2 type transport system ATP-binding protein